MNANKVMALLFGEEINTDWWCEKCQAYIDDRQVIYQEIHEICGCPVYIKEPVYHDLEGWMTGETIRKIQEKMPETWKDYVYGYLTGPIVEVVSGKADPKTVTPDYKRLQKALSLHNFLHYLREHKEEWAYKICDNHGVDTKYFIGPCNFCHGTGKIINPAYAEALRELEEGE